MWWVHGAAGSEDWMDGRWPWVVGQTVEEVNALWETRRCAGWWREGTHGVEAGGGHALKH